VSGKLVEQWLGELQVLLHEKVHIACLIPDWVVLIEVTYPHGIGGLLCICP
jgi:hypothetical protein